MGVGHGKIEIPQRRQETKKNFRRIMQIQNEFHAFVILFILFRLGTESSLGIGTVIYI